MKYILLENELRLLITESYMAGQKEKSENGIFSKSIDYWIKRAKPIAKKFQKKIEEDEELQHEHEERSCETCGRDRNETLHPYGDNVCYVCAKYSNWKPKQNQLEQKPSAEWSKHHGFPITSIPPGVLSIKTAQHMADAINNNAEGIQLCLDNGREVESRLSLFEDNVDWIANQLSYLKERFDDMRQGNK